MCNRHFLTLAMASLVLCSSGSWGAAPAQTMSQIRQDRPNLMTVNRFGKIHKIVDKDLATGNTPLASAKNFIQTFSSALGVDSSAFIERGPFPTQQSELQLMFVPETGEHKFTGVYFMQTADGLPVFGSRLMVLTRNVPGFPASSATTDLRDVMGYKKPSRLVQSEAIALMAAATRLGRGATISETELMVFAGTDKKHHEPTAALVFVATLGGSWDPETYKKVEMVVDAQTGAQLHETNLLLHVDGRVEGLATESSGADVCEAESAAGLPYAKVTLNGNTAYADSNGDFTIDGAGTITSTLDGQWFDSQNQSGSDASLSQDSTDPYFMHNDLNNNEQYRAQVNAYLHSNIVRDFTLTYAPAFPVIANQTSFPVKTGVSGTCNAFYDYSSINFYNAGNGCSNTAFSVIVHHEYGHHLVASAGSGQGEYGEGMGDVMGVLITGDNQLARGFYSNDCDNGIRNADNTYQFGGNCSGIHDCGQLISGCVWDAVIAIEADYPGQGVEIVATLALNSMPMHSGDAIDPSITTDWLTLDDDDGDLSNGTPHSEQILAAFALHNMDDWPPPATYACCIEEECNELTAVDCSDAGGVWRNGYYCNQVSCIPLANDFCNTAQPISDGDWDLMTLGALSDNDPYSDAQCTGTYLGQMYADVWFSYIACGDGSMVVATCDQVDFDTDLVVYDGECGTLNQVACNGDGEGCSNYSSSATFNVTEGTQYFIRIGGWDSSAEGMGLLTVDGPGDGCDVNPSVEITYPDGRPELLDPNGGTVVNIDVLDGKSSPIGGQLYWNDGSGWSSVSLDNSYDAIFPSLDCGASVDWYISVDSADGESSLSPASAPSSTWNAFAYSGSEVTFNDNFNNDLGWDVDNGAGEGNWVRGIPSEGGDRCDPGSDGDSSGMCYVTGNSGDEDVDDGTTTLYSPPMEFSNGAILSYSRWYSNGLDCNGAEPNSDYFYVDININGTGWDNLETVGPVVESSGGWYDVEHVLSGNGTIQIRFACGDEGAGSIIEAGVDAVSVKSNYCEDTTCEGDINGDSIVDVTDLLEVVGSWGSPGGSADVNEDGIVNVADLLAIVDAWGSCP